MTLVANGQEHAGFTLNFDHLLALGNVVRHQLFAQHMLAGFHRLDGDRSVLTERHGDDHHLDFRIGEQFFVVLVNLDLFAGRLAELLVETDAMFIAVALEGSFAV